MIVVGVVTLFYHLALCFVSLYVTYLLYQNSSRMVQQLLEEYGIKGSMSKPGYPYDNSCVESFFASMKKEYILRKEYDGMSVLSRNCFTSKYSITGNDCTAHWVP